MIVAIYDWLRSNKVIQILSKGLVIRSICLSSLLHCKLKPFFAHFAGCSYVNKDGGCLTLSLSEESACRSLWAFCSVKTRCCKTSWRKMLPVLPDLKTRYLIFAIVIYVLFSNQQFSISSSQIASNQIINNYWASLDKISWFVCGEQIN